MISARLQLSNKQSTTDFLNFIREGISYRLNEIILSKQYKTALESDLDILCKRYQVSLSSASYLRTLASAIDYSINKNVLTVKLSQKSKYYRIIKSIELGSYKIIKISLLGKILVMLNSIVNRLYTDYEILIEKLRYYRDINSIQYKIYSKYSLYSIHQKLSNKVRLM